MLPAVQAQLQAAHDEVVRSLEVMPDATGQDRILGVAS